jgi:hypothetical protein
VSIPRVETPSSSEYPVGGIHSAVLKATTPKYARNEGHLSNTYTDLDAMARIYVRVDAPELTLFLNSIHSDQVRRVARRALAGDLSPDPTTPTGYVDFLLTGVSQPLSEMVQVSSSLSDNYAAFFFGQAPPTWSYNGMLINSKQDDQASNFQRLYLEILRGTQLARRQKLVSIRYDSVVVTGAMMNLVTNLDASNELAVPFSFNLLVKRIHYSNVTHNWNPSQAGSPFVTDPLFVPYDGRPRSDTALRSFAMTTNPNLAPNPGANPTNANTATPPATPPLVSTPPVTMAPAPAATTSASTPATPPTPQRPVRAVSRQSAAVASMSTVSTNPASTTAPPLQNVSRITSANSSTPARAFSSAPVSSSGFQTTSAPVSSSGFQTTSAPVSSSRGYAVPPDVPTLISRPEISPGPPVSLPPVSSQP